MELHWYPGHMAKARRELHARLKLVDVVLEIIDARIPESSRHPQLIASGRPLPRVLLLSKADLADNTLTNSWLEHFRRDGIPAMAGDLRSGRWVRGARRLLRAAAAGRRRRQTPARVLVAGLPNVGKSTAINSLAGRAKATTGGHPGVTRALQWLSGGPGLQLLDSPGVMWPETIHGDAAVHLAATGAVPETVYEPETVAKALLKKLAAAFPQHLAARYGDGLGPDEDDLLEHVARRRGCLLAGGEPDLARAAAMVLTDFRTGRLGRLTLERPPVNDGDDGEASG